MWSAEDEGWRLPDIPLGLGRPLARKIPESADSDPQGTFARPVFGTSLTKEVAVGDQVKLHGYPGWFTVRSILADRQVIEVPYSAGSAASRWASWQGVAYVKPPTMGMLQYPEEDAR